MEFQSPLLPYCLPPRGLSLEPLLLPIQRFARLGTNFQNAGDAVEETLVLDGVSALEQFDVVGGCVDFLGQLRLGHLVGSLLATSVPDVGSDFRPGFLHGNDVVRSVDLRQTLSVGTRFVDLEGRDDLVGG